MLESLWGFTIATGVIAALWTAGITWLDHGRFGRALTALAENISHAESLGIRRKRIYLLSFLIAGVGSLITNTFFPIYLHLLSPSDYGFAHMIFFIMIVVAGGPGKIRGVLIATFLLYFFKEGLRFVPLPADILGAVWWRRESIFPPQRQV
jgi:branched-chain amino acid transport system permease protein